MTSPHSPGHAGPGRALGALDDQRTPNSATAKRRLRFAIIGGGMAGILSAIKLAEADHDDFVIYEKVDRMDGAWREHTYPGIACDVTSHLDSYSFEPNPDRVMGR